MIDPNHVAHVASGIAARLRAQGRPARAAAVTARAAAAVLVALVSLSHDGEPIPSVQEIAREAGVSAPSTVRHHLRTLAELDLVKLPAPGTPRSVRVTEAGRELARGDA